MQVSVEESGAIERKLTVTIARGEVDAEIKKRLRKLAQTVRLPGFRPGKVPQNLINKRFVGQVTNEVVNEFVSSTYREAVAQEKLRVADLVNVELKPFMPDLIGGATGAAAMDTDLRYVATVEVHPQVPNPTLEGVMLYDLQCEVDDADVDAAVEGIRKQMTEYVAKDGAARDGDRLSVDLEGKVDGEKQPTLAQKNMQFVLGARAVFVEFERELAGASRGVAKQVTLTLPAEFPNAALAGKSAQFAVTVNAVERAVLPELGDEFARKLGVDVVIAGSGMQKVREELNTRMQSEAATRIRNLMQQQVIMQLMRINDVEAPNALVEQEIDNMIANFERELEAEDEPPLRDELRPKLREESAAKARKIVCEALILRAAVEKFGLKAESVAVRNRLEAMLGERDDRDAALRWYYDDPKRLQPVEARLLEEQAMAKLLASATLVPRKVEFAKLNAGLLDELGSPVVNSD